MRIPFVNMRIDCMTCFRVAFGIMVLMAFFKVISDPQGYKDRTEFKRVAFTGDAELKMYLMHWLTFRSSYDKSKFCREVIIPVCSDVLITTNIQAEVRKFCEEITDHCLRYDTHF